MGIWYSGIVRVCVYAVVTILPHTLLAVEDHPEPQIETGGSAPQQVFEVDVAIAQAELIQNQNIEIRTQRGSIYTFPYEHSADFAMAYELLSEEEQIKFQENRLLFLTKAATILDRAELGVGSGSLIKRRLSQYGRKIKNGVIQLFSKNSFESAPTRDLTLKERGHEVIQTILDQFDERLWLRAPVVVKRNEIYASVSLSLIAQAGVGKVGAGGLAGLGVNFGLNKNTEEAVFEIYAEFEKHKFGAPFVASLAVVPKLGVSLSQVQVGNETEASVGETAYPPGGYFSSCDKGMTLGFSTNIGFPPLVSDFMCYLNTHRHYTLLRVTASSQRKGLLRFKLGRMNMPQKKMNCSEVLTNKKSA